MNEALLRNFLQDWIAEEYSITELEKLGDEFDSLELPIPHCEIYRRTCESRLAGLKRVRPDLKWPQEQQQAALNALSSIRPDEKLFHWSARGESRDYFGVSSASGIISFFAHKPQNNE